MRDSDRIFKYNYFLIKLNCIWELQINNNTFYINKKLKYIKMKKKISVKRQGIICKFYLKDDF